MKNLNGRKVSELRIHQTTLIQGYGNIKNLLTTSNQVSNDTEMTLVEGGIMVQARSPKTKKVQELFIPNGNIVSAQLLPDVEGQLDITSNKGTNLVTAKGK